MCVDEDEYNGGDTEEQPSAREELSSVFFPSEMRGIWQVPFHLPNKNLGYRLLRGLEDREVTSGIKRK